MLRHITQQVGSTLSGLLLTFALAACHNLQQQPVAVEPEQPATPAGAAVAETATVHSERAEVKRPAIELTEDILYKLLVAEIAGQRGELDIAVQNYLELARRTQDPEVASRATRIAVYAQNDEAAFEAARIWSRLEPENADARQVLAIMAVRDGHIDQALEHFDRILTHSSGALDQKLWIIANLLGKEKDQSIVKQIMEQLMQGHDDDPEALYAYAHVLARMDENERAKEVLERILTLVPDNLNATMSYVSLLQKQGDTEAALQRLEKSLKAQKDNFNLRLFYARLLTDDKRFAEALQQFEILHARAPDNPDVLYALGLLYLQSNQLDESETHFKRLSEQESGRTSEANYYLGRIAEEKGNLKQAISWYETLQEGNNYFDAQIRLSFILAKQGKIQEAREHLNSVRAEGTKQKNTLIQAEGELLTDEKRYQDALEVYNKALKDNFDPDLLYSRAMLAEKMGRLDILERDLRAIIEKNPDNSQALNALGYTLADQTDRYEEAHKYIKRAHELNPDDFYILDSMGWVLYRLGRLEESVHYLNKALSLRNDAEIAAHLGEVLWVMGDREAARAVWETALQEQPEDARLLDVIKRFNP